MDAADARVPQRGRRDAADRRQRRPGSGDRQHPRHPSLPDLLPKSLLWRPQQDGEHGDDAPLAVLTVLQHRRQRAGAVRILHDVRDRPRHERRRHLFVRGGGFGRCWRLADEGNRDAMGELRHGEFELPIQCRRGPFGAGELREPRPREPGVTAVVLSVEPAELVGLDAVARHRPGRHGR